MRGRGLIREDRGSALNACTLVHHRPERAYRPSSRAADVPNNRVRKPGNANETLHCRVAWRTLNDLAAQIPDYLVQQRALLLLDDYNVTAGLAEERCPACEGRGHIDPDPLVRCPICKGWGEVPTSLAIWFREHLACRLAAPTARLEAGKHAYRVYKMERQVRRMKADGRANDKLQVTSERQRQTA